MADNPLVSATGGGHSARRPGGGRSAGGPTGAEVGGRDPYDSGKEASGSPRRQGETSAGPARAAGLGASRQEGRGGPEQLAG